MARIVPQGVMTKYAFWLTYTDAVARLTPPKIETPTKLSMLRNYGRRLLKASGDEPDKE
jgi:hypothetical protein